MLWKQDYNSFFLRECLKHSVRKIRWTSRLSLQGAVTMNYFWNLLTEKCRLVLGFRPLSPLHSSFLQWRVWSVWTLLLVNPNYTAMAIVTTHWSSKLIAPFSTMTSFAITQPSKDIPRTLNALEAVFDLVKSIEKSGFVSFMSFIQYNKKWKRKTKTKRKRKKKLFSDCFITLRVKWEIL